MVPLCQQGWGRKGDTYRVGIRNSNSVVDATNISNKRLIKMFINSFVSQTAVHTGVSFNYVEYLCGFVECISSPQHPDRVVCLCRRPRTLLPLLVSTASAL